MMVREICCHSLQEIFHRSADPVSSLIGGGI